MYVALPLSTIDWSCPSGAAIPIEERAEDEVLTATGRGRGGDIETVRLADSGSRAANPAFDITPAALVTGLITDRGAVAASVDSLAALQPG